MADETLTGNGIKAGISVSPSRATIQLSRTGPMDCRMRYLAAAGTAQARWEGSDSFFEADGDASGF